MGPQTRTSGKKAVLAYAFRNEPDAIEHIRVAVQHLRWPMRFKFQSASSSSRGSDGQPADDHRRRACEVPQAEVLSSAAPL